MAQALRSDLVYRTVLINRRACLGAPDTEIQTQHRYRSDDRGCPICMGNPLAITMINGTKGCTKVAVHARCQLSIESGDFVIPSVRSARRLKMRICLLIAVATITMPGGLVLAQIEEPFEQHGACDFNGFLESVKQVQAIRKERLLSAKQFAEFSKDRNTIVLDARGESDFVVLHVKGSKNLPYTSFGLKSLRELIRIRKPEY